jgi:putative ABC transport system substrate-binding protein
MRRRDFITFLGGVTATWPMAARAQRSDQVRQIGVLENVVEGDPDTLSLIYAFRQRLEELGWSEGRNARIDIRWSAGDSNRIRAYAAELAASSRQLFLAGAHPWLRLCSRPRMQSQSFS